MLRKQKKLRIKQALKVTLACFFCILINYIFQLPTALNFFSVISVFVLYANFPEEIYQKTFERLIGVLLVSIIAFFAISFFGKAHLIIYWSVVLATVFISGALARYKYGYVFLVGGIAGSIIMLQAVDQTQQQALKLLLMINIQVLLAWVSILIFEFLFPVYHRNNLLESLKFIRNSHVKYLLSFERYGKDQVSLVRESDFFLLEKYLKQCKKTSFTQRKKMRKIVSVLEVLLYEFRILKLAYLKFSKTKLFLHYQLDLNDLFKLLRQQLMQLPNDLKLANEFEQAYKNFERKITKDRANKVLRKYSYEQVMELLAIKNIFSQLVLIFQAGVSRELLAYAMPPDKTKETYKLLPMTGLRLVFTIGVIIVGKYVFAWQDVLQMTIAAIVMSVQPNLGKSIGRMKQRFYGVAIGGAVAVSLLTLLHLLPMIPVFLFFILTSLAVFAYMALGDEHYSYIGLQAGLLIPLVLMGHGIDQGNIYVAWDRLVSVLQGTVVGSIAVVIFAPKFPLSIFRQNRKKLFNLYGEFFSGMINGNNLNARENFSSGFMAHMNKTLLDTRLNLQDLSQVMRKKSKLKQKIDQLIPVFINISLNIRVINMLFAKQKNCQKTMGYLSPICEQLVCLFQEANKTWRYKNKQSRSKFLAHAIELEQSLKQRLQDFRNERIASIYNLEELEAYGLFLTAFVNIAESMKDYARVIARVS